MLFRSQAWGEELTAVQRAAWDTYAANVSWLDSLGQAIQLSGINHYIRANTPRLQALAEVTIVGGTSVARVDAGPTTFLLGVSPAVTAAAIAFAAGPPITNTLTIDWSNGTALDNAVLLYCSPPQNPSINFYKGPYLLMSEEAGDNDQVVFKLTDSVTPTRYQLAFGGLAAGQQVFWQLRSSMDDGRLSSRVRGSAVVPTQA